ncbi:uncharacterized protein LOC132893502 [Neoarius graeffei]|uniref:uncharacterized protein LOC132893502 n=1 Tax=Neoarius graeffei TaxID=443677 RepID=UPI00298D364E|nr:uncharacterized protein LOC132893502 [Neoarius graeffei]XP_060788749.1 uncharacterized protein LOC132893502 [Neoarius graeffei]XP_060788790.1 uncharacterized protein LOC132893502 [Neoarius graeffei]
MQMPMMLRVVVDEGDYRRLELDPVPTNLTKLYDTIRQAFGISRDFRIQFKDPVFNDEYMNITSIMDLQDRSTIKLVYIGDVSTASWSTGPSTHNVPSTSWSPVERSSSQSAASVSSQSSDTDDTVILSHSDSELRECPWPREFPIPRFPYNVELQLQRGNECFRETGSLLNITPGLKTDIMEKLAEEIFSYTAYPRNNQFDDVAAALVKKFPCLKDHSACGYYAWMISLKYKMANHRTKMRAIGCPEVTINSLKNKSKDDCLPAKNVKKARKAEVNYCPSNPAGETDESLEKLRVELLNDVEQRDRTQLVKEKMSRTFAFRRKEVVHGTPSAAEFKARWPALFCAGELQAEFQRITTLPLMSTFMAKLDSCLPQLTSVLRKKGGIPGQKLAKHVTVLTETTSPISQKRSAALKSLCIYLGEKDEDLIREYMDIQGLDIEREFRKQPMGIYLICKDGGDAGDHEDIGIHVEGTIVLDNIASEAQACVFMFAIIYVMNMAYPCELRYFYEFVQKVLMEMDRERVSPRVYGLKHKLDAAL